MGDAHRPVSFYIRGDLTDEQVRADLMAAMDDPRVSEAFKMLRATTRTLPFATVIAAVFSEWDALDASVKMKSLIEMLGVDLEWLAPSSLFENITAWESPWDDFKTKGGDHA